tara:strand:- start:67 stop:2178 length:2112 start_codon:yes stop_codon:yes gene_type:complete
VRINEWVTRDFDRAFSIIDREYFPLAGSEVNEGGRLPGPFLYILLAIPLLFNYSYESIFIFNFSLNIASIVMLFFVVRRFFGFYAASFSTILLLVNLQHIDSAGFPINPAFIFPFIVFFMWFLLELVLNKNPKFFPLIVLVISLATQLHYSVATYIIIPILAAITFRIKIPLKSIFLSFLFFIICFSPYFVYKHQMFEPNYKLKIIYGEGTKLSAFQLFKRVTVQNTVKRLTFFNGVNNYELFRHRYALVNYFILNASFIYLLTFVIRNIIIKRNLQSCSKEIVVLLMFYIPALIYEITNPFLSHQWYNYIFVPPTVLVTAVFLTSLYQNSKTRFTTIFITANTLILLGYLANYTDFAFHRYKRIIERQLTGHKALSYKNTSLIINALLDELQLSSDEYFKSVYFDGFSPFSHKRLQLIKKSIHEKTGNNKRKSEKTCFYLVDYLRAKSLDNSNAVEIKENIARKNMFLADKTIEINHPSTRKLFVSNKKSIKGFLLYEYSPLGEQPCYQNSFNPFVVNKKTRNLLIESNGMNKGIEPVVLKTIYNKGIYDLNLVLDSLETNHIIFDELLQTPIRIKINLKRNNGSYALRVEVDLYAFVRDTSRFNLKQLSISIISNSSSQSPIASKQFHIISPDSWLSNNTSNNGYSNQLNWYKEFALPSGFELKKDEFQINLVGSFKTNSPCCRELVIKNIESSPAVEVKS